MKKINRIIMVLAVGVVCGAFAEVPVITDIVVRQRWPWSKLVDIEYVLICDQTEEVDVLLQAFDGNQSLILPPESLSGALYNVKRGYNRIVWDPTKCDFAINEILPQFKVSLTPTVVPLYMIIDLTLEAGSDGQIEYVYETALTNNEWGAWQRNPITNDGVCIESVIWNDVTNDVYKTDKLVMRRVNAGSFCFGQDGGENNTTLTKGFYIGVFQVTQQQWFNIMCDTKNAFFYHADSKAYRPMETVTYNEIRGTSFGTNWPGVDGKGDYRVDADSVIGTLRTKSGMHGFDLPTEAQWEYACRAGTTTYYNDGNAPAPNDGYPNSTTSNTFMDVLGRYRYNGGGTDSTSGSSGPEAGTAIVGSYLPNAWGLYDMHGNVFEWCLDWHDTRTVGIDPLGAFFGSRRVLRGGRYHVQASVCRSTARLDELPSKSYRSLGFRLVYHLL